MVWIPGGTFRMGSEKFYPEERPVHDVTVDGFWMDRSTVTNEQFARFVEATGYVTLAERPPNPADFPGAPPENLVPGSMVFQKTRRAGRPAQLRQLVGVGAWRRLAPSDRVRTARSTGLSKASGRPRRVRGRRSLRALGGQRAADRGRVGVRGARRARRRHLHLGRRGIPRRQGHGELLAGRVPLAEPAHRRSRRYLAGRLVSAEWLRPVRHGRQCVGVDERLVRAARRGPDRQVVLHAVRSTRASSRPRRATTRASLSSAFRARWSRAARTCARPTTASAIDPQRANHR